MLYSHAFTVKPAIAKSVERLAVNQEVGGSSPLRGNIFVLLELLIRITKKKQKKNYTMYKTRYREALFELDINLVDIEKNKSYNINNTL